MKQSRIDKTLFSCQHKDAKSTYPRLFFSLGSGSITGVIDGSPYDLIVVRVAGFRLSKHPPIPAQS